MGKKIGAVLAGLLLVAILVLFEIFEITSESSEGRGFTYEPVVFDDIAFTLVGSEHTGTSHTFYLRTENVGNNSVDVSSIFAVLDGDKRYSTSNVEYDNERMNPGLNGTITVSFEMPEEVLTHGAPVLEIDRGLINKDTVEIPLNNAKKTAD